MSFTDSTSVDRKARERVVDRDARVRFSISLIALVLALLPRRAAGQVRSEADTLAARVAAPSASDGRRLDSLTALALAENPKIRAAAMRSDAARHRVVIAGTRPDPMLMAGIQNLPLGKESASTSMSGAALEQSGPDPMTMRMLGVTQSIPYPGKIALRQRIAEHEARSAEAGVESARREVARDVKDAYYELAFLDKGLAIVARNRDMIASIIRVTDARYGLGTIGQQDVLKARLEASRLAETASSLTEQRHAALARLNALLGRASESPVVDPAVPSRIVRAAVGNAPDDVRFVSNALGARAAGSRLPDLVTLQETAIANDPTLREHEAMIDAQASRVELARKEGRPDVDVAVQYGQRGGGLPDMVSASVSVPLPIFRRRKQDEGVLEATALLHSLHAEHEAGANDLRASVARLVSELERQRTQLALYARAMLPQGRATLTATTAGFQVGKADLLAVLDVQSMLFATETDYFRALTDFARNLAELERLTGKEIGS
jgi:outer membrane protein, heavy metal efflux system